jgi:MinD-like ATPase involved in chromosome partitioning or flagellar assembly/CRP-like cAMP-binding protein
MTDQRTFAQILLSEARTSLQGVLAAVQLEDREVLFNRDDPGDAFYIIDSGRIRIFTFDEEGQELTLNTLGPGETLGELALVDDQPRSASASAIGPCALRRLSRDDFLRMVHNSPVLSQAVVQLLSRRVRHMTDYIEYLGHWSRMVAAGQYNQAMASIRDMESTDRAFTAVADAVGQMVKAVKEREEKLRKELAQLRIQIDEKKRQEHVSEIIETDYFRDLSKKARDLREGKVPQVEQRQLPQRRAQGHQERRPSPSPRGLFRRRDQEVLMGKIVSIHSFRGGTGKSNISANVAAQLALRGKRVGVIDTDIASPGIHVIFGMDEDRIDKALNDYLWGRCPIEETAYDVGAQLGGGEVVLMSGGIYLIPSSLRAGEIARVLREGYDVGLLNDGFRDLIKNLDLDFLIIDTHPGLNEETLLSIAISDLLLIIMRPDQQDFQGTAVTVDVARKLDVPHLYLVINKAIQSLDFDDLTKHVEEIYDAQVAAILPLSEDVARLASSDIFSLRFPGHPVSDAILKITAAVEAIE